MSSRAVLADIATDAWWVLRCAQNLSYILYWLMLDIGLWYIYIILQPIDRGMQLNMGIWAPTLEHCVPSKRIGAPISRNMDGAVDTFSSSQGGCLCTDCILQESMDNASNNNFCPTHYHVAKSQACSFIYSKYFCCPEENFIACTWLRHTSGSCEGYVARRYGLGEMWRHINP